MDNTTLLGDAIGGICLVLAIIIPLVIYEVATTIKYNKEMKKRRLSR